MSPIYAAALMLLGAVTSQPAAAAHTGSGSGSLAGKPPYVHRKYREAFVARRQQSTVSQVEQSALHSQQHHSGSRAEHSMYESAEHYAIGNGVDYVTLPFQVTDPAALTAATTSNITGYDSDAINTVNQTAFHVTSNATAPQLLTGNVYALNVSVNDLIFNSSTGVPLYSYGDIVTYADYWGATEKSEVICLGDTADDRIRRFQNIFAQVWNDTDARYVTDVRNVYLQDTSQLAELDTLAITNTSSNYQGKIIPDSNAIVSLSDNAFVFNDSNDLKEADYLANYAFVTLYNFDHFNNCSHAAYAAGHQWSLQVAKQASSIALTSQANVDAAREALIYAYAINAFAEHFITDAFASGHLRTPRNDIADQCTFWYESSTIELAQAGLSANRQHNEDNINGLYVRNALNQTFWTYGDGLYDLQQNNVSRQVMNEALAVSREEVWLAFRGNLSDSFITNQTTYGAILRAPAIGSADEFPEQNTCAMYKVDADGTMYTRSPGPQLRSTQSWYYSTGAVTNNFTQYNGSFALPPNGEFDFTIGNLSNPTACSYVKFDPDTDCASLVEAGISSLVSEDSVQAILGVQPVLTYYPSVKAYYAETTTDTHFIDDNGMYNGTSSQSAPDSQVNSTPEPTCSGLDKINPFADCTNGKK